MQRLIHLAALAVAANLAQPAWADVFLSAKLGNISYTLEDLDPADGIAPFLIFNDVPSAASGAYMNHFVHDASVYVPNPDVIEQYQQGHGAFGPLALSDMDGKVQVSLTGNGTLVGTSMQAFGELPTAVGLNGTFFASVGTGGAGDFASLFTLTPNTKVRFSADYDLTARLSYGELTTQGYDYASAQASLYVSNPSGWQSSSDQASATDILSHDWSQGIGRTSSGSLSGVFSNVTSDYVDGRVSLRISIHGDSMAAAIPEPSTLASTLLGLALMAALFARQRRNVGPGT